MDCRDGEETAKLTEIVWSAEEMSKRRSGDMQKSVA